MPAVTLQHIAHFSSIEFMIRKLCYLSSIHLYRLLPTSPTLTGISTNLPNIVLQHENKHICIGQNKTKKSPLWRIVKLTNTLSSPTLSPLFKPPWKLDLNVHERVSSRLPLPKDQRGDYEKEITKKIRESEDRSDTLVVATDGSKRTGAEVVVKQGKEVIWRGL